MKEDVNYLKLYLKSDVAIPANLPIFPNLRPQVLADALNHYDDERADLAKASNIIKDPCEAMEFAVCAKFADPPPQLNTSDPKAADPKSQKDILLPLDWFTKQMQHEQASSKEDVPLVGNDKKLLINAVAAQLSMLSCRAPDQPTNLRVVKTQKEDKKGILRSSWEVAFLFRILKRFQATISTAAEALTR